MRVAPFVIAVSGTSGAGKSTIVEGLAAAAVLRGRRVVTLQFDDCVGASMLPDDLQDWLERGANPDDWRTDQLIADLMANIAAGSEPETLIIVEEPFGRARPPMRTLVDLGIHIDLPLGVALARRLHRDFVPGLADPTGQGAQRLRDYLTQYVRGAGLLTRPSTRWRDRPATSFWMVCRTRRSYLSKPSARWSSSSSFLATGSRPPEAARSRWPRAA